MKIIPILGLALVATTAAANERSPALRSALQSDESGKFTGSVEMPEFADEGEREAFLGATCTGIERLLGGTVQCECTPQILSGALFFDCDSWRDVTIRQRVIYTPSFNGVFSVGLTTLDVSFGTGYCLDGFSVFVEQVNMFLNLGDICFSGTVKLDADLDSSTPLVTPRLDSCTFTAGEFGECDACEPCTTETGETGFSVTCDFVEIATCVPLGLPFGRSSRRVNPQLFGEQIVDGMLELAQPDIDRLISDVEGTGKGEPDDFEDPDDSEEPDEPIIEEPDDSEEPDEPIIEDPDDAEEPDEPLVEQPDDSEEPDEPLVEEPDDAEEPDEPLVEEPGDAEETLVEEPFKAKTDKKKDIEEDDEEGIEEDDEEDTEEEALEEPIVVDAPDWGEPNVNVGRKSFWDKIWPF